MTVPRTKGISTKVTQAEYATLERVAAGETLSEWTRGVLLKAATTPPPDPAVAEILALRTIVLNLLFKIANGQPVTAEDMRRLIDRADGDKLRRAHERLAPVTGARDE
jgi:hypothetical protein